MPVRGCGPWPPRSTWGAIVRERRLLLGFLLVTVGTVGVWALLFPASFHNSFPLGRGWVSLDGPYSEHLIRDVGALNLALAAVLAWAIREPTTARTGLAASAMLIYAVPHLVYHSTHLEPFEPMDAAAQTLALALLVAVPIWLLWRTRKATS